MHLPYKLFELGHPQIPENVRPHSSNYIENATPLYSIQLYKRGPVQQHIPISLLLGSPPPLPLGLNVVNWIDFVLYRFLIAEGPGT